MLRKWMCEEDGLEMVEWAIVAAVIVSAAAALVSQLSVEVVNQFAVVLANVSV